MLDGSTSVETGEFLPAKRQPVPPEHGKFQKGVSGNPRGRPKKDLDLAALAQKHAEKAVLTLAEVMANESAPPSARVSAAAEILDRGFGRAPANLDVKHTMGISEEFEGFMRAIVGKRTPQVIDAEEIVSQDVASRHD